MKSSPLESGNSAEKPVLERAGELSPRLFPPANAGHPLVWFMGLYWGAGQRGKVRLVALSIE